MLYKVAKKIVFPQSLPPGFFRPMSEVESNTDAATEAAKADAEAAEAAEAAETAKKTGRGFLVITGAKIWFMITGAVIQLGLPIFLGSPEQFGVFKIVTEAISLINMVMIIGSLQAVSKLVSERPHAAQSIINQALKLQCLLGLPIAALYALGSPWIAAQFNDPTLTHLIRLSSLIIAFYAFYAIFVGYFNGVKEFVRQASLDIGFATLKMAGIVGLVLLGFGVGGAIAGFVGAAGIICLVSGVWVFRRMRRHAERFPAKEEPEGAPKEAFTRLFGYLVLIMLYTFALNGLMRADLFILKRIASEVPAHLAGAEPLFALISNKFSGLYGAVLNIARIPYQGVIAVTFVIFPLISESTFKKDREKTRAYITDTFRYCLLLIASVGALLALNADSIIAGLYSSEYRAASSALAILSVSIIFFALYYMATTIIIGAGRPAVAVVIMAASLLLSGGLNYWFVDAAHEATVAGMSWSPLAVESADSAQQAVQNAVALASHDASLAGPYLLEAPTYMDSAAIATTIAMFVGFVLAMLWLWRTYRASAPPMTVVRIFAALAALYGVDYLIELPVAWVDDYGKLAFLGIVAAKMAVMGLVFLVVMFVLREFGDKDLDRIKAVIGKG
jgi:O-antigen/teichoic acid export membrane protein